MTGHVNIERIASGMGWTRGKFDELKVLDKWLAILETVSHVEFLSHTGVCRGVNKPRLEYSLVRNDWARVEGKYRGLLTGSPISVKAS